MDLSPVKTREAFLESGEKLILPLEVNYYYIQTQEQADSLIPSFVEFASHSRHFLAVDIETSGFCPHLDKIYLVQIGLPTGEQYIFDMRKEINPECLKPILHSPCWKAGHNLKFDAKFLKNKYGIVLSNMFDTFIAEKIIRGGTEEKNTYKLDQVVYRHTNLLMELESYELNNTEEQTSLKDGHKSIDDKKTDSAKERLQASFMNYPEGKPFSPAQLAYAASDTAVLFLLIEKQLTLLHKSFPNMLYTPWLEYIEDPTTKEFFKKLYPETLTLWSTAALEFAFLEVVVDLELYGVKFDLETHEKVIELITAEYAGHRRDFLQAIAGSCPQRTLLNTAAVNPDSPSQVLVSLRDDLGIDIKENSTDVKVLQRLLEDLDEGTVQYRAVHSLLSYRKMSKLLDAFGDKLAEQVNPNTGCIHSDVNQVIRTGRSSVRNPNFQQIPRSISWRQVEGISQEELQSRPGFRQCFVPHEGYKFIVTDYSQQELRIAAAGANESFMLNAYEKGKDLHSAMAAELAHMEYDEFIELLNSGDPVAKEKRYVAKTVNFGLIYGLSPYNLSRQMSISIEEARGIFDNIWKTYKDLKQKMESIHHFSNKHGFSNTIIGRQRFYGDILDRIKWIRAASAPSVLEGIARDNKLTWLYEGINEFTGKFNEITVDNLEQTKEKMLKKFRGVISRQGGNHFVQGSAADVTKLAATIIRRKLINNGLDAKIVLIVHDELVIEVREDLAEKVKDLVEEEMNNAMKKLFPLVPSVAEGNIADTWVK